MSPTPLPLLLGRGHECATFDELVARLRAGGSAVCVVRGEAGIGKSVLLDYLVDRGSDLRVLRTQGVEADMELAFAGLQQLCAPVMSDLDDLPEPQRLALSIAFGLIQGDPPGRFLVGLAVLNLLTRASETRPVLAVVDDAQWLDQVSLQTLEFVARRLLAEPVAMAFAIREPEGASALPGLPVLPVGALGPAAAGELLDTVVEGRLEDPVRARLVAETRGNPLALLELHRGRSAGELAYGLERAPVGSTAARVEQDYVRRLAQLPAATQSLVLLAAADPLGDPHLLARAAEVLGLRMDLSPADDAGLIATGDTVRFRHPLARSGVYRAARLEERRAAHRALALATDPDRAPDRRAWHAAQASAEPDEDVAADLEQSADRARSRGGMAAEAVLLERAAGLTPDPAHRGRRALGAAEAYFSAASPDRASELADLAEMCPLSPLDEARLGRLRARVLFGRSRSDEAAPLLLDAASRFADQGSPLARETYLEAISATVFAGRVHGPAGARAAAIAARTSGTAAPGSAPPDLLLDGVATLLADGYASGVPPLRRAVEPFAHEQLDTRDATMRWLMLAPVALEASIHYLWDLSAWQTLSERAVQLARETGALGVLPPALVYAAGVHIHRGDLAAARRLLVESDSLAEATGQAPHTYARLVLAGWSGEESETAAMIEMGRAGAAERGEVSLLGVTGYVQGVLYNGLGRYDLALEGARSGIEHDGFNFIGNCLVEHVEAAVRCGETALAEESWEALVPRTRAAGTGWALGLEARCEALLRSGDAAERLYLTALEELNRHRVMIEVARAHLLYGEWLRRERRRVEARDQLRLAHEMCTRMQVRGFARRARRELLAAGEQVRAGDDELDNQLTPQEAQIAALVADGMTNPQVGAELFLSPHTVEWHLRKVYAKLGIHSRRELRDALSTTDTASSA